MLEWILLNWKFSGFFFNSRNLPGSSDEHLLFYFFLLPYSHKICKFVCLHSVVEIIKSSCTVGWYFMKELELPSMLLVEGHTYMYDPDAYGWMLVNERIFTILLHSIKAKQLPSKDTFSGALLFYMTENRKVLAASSLRCPHKENHNLPNVNQQKV